MKIYEIINFKKIREILRSRAVVLLTAAMLSIPFALNGNVSMAIGNGVAVYTPQYSVEDVLNIEYKVRNFRIYKAFVTAVGKKESGNNYSNDRNMPYWGYYQMGPAVRKTLGVKKTWQEFKTDSAYQETLMLQNLRYNERIISKEYFDYFIGRKINGVEVTRSGILAGAHIAGAGGVKRYLYSGGKHNPHDKFGTRISDYMRMFGGYDFTLEHVEDGAVCELVEIYDSSPFRQSNDYYILTGIKQANDCR